MVLDRGAVTRETSLERHRSSHLEAREILGEGTTTLASRELSQAGLRVRRDVCEQVVADEGDAGAVVDEQRIRHAVTRAMNRPQIASPGADGVAVYEDPIRRVLGAVAHDVGEEGLAVIDQLLWDAVYSEQGPRDRALGGDTLLIVDAPRGRRGECGDVCS